MPLPVIGAASDTAAGTVELATDVETQAGTDNTRAVTPSSLASMVATESLAGLVELASVAEGLAGTSTSLVPTVAVVKEMIDAATADLNVTEIIAGDGTGGTTASGVTLTPLPGENYWPVDLSGYPEGPDANGDPVDFVINIPAVPDQHKIYIKAVNDSASAQRRLVINQTGSLNGTDPATGNSIIIAHDDDSVVLFSRSDGTNFTGYDVVASHIFQNAVTGNGNAADTASSDVLYDEVSEDAGTKTWTVAEMGNVNWWGLHADTTTGPQIHVLPSAWLTPSREFTINRVGDNDITVVVDDGREIDGEALGSILLIPGRADYKVLDDADNTIVLTTPLPHNAGASEPTPINQVPVALGEVVTTTANTPLRFPLASFDLDGIVSAPNITQPANGTVTIVSDNVIEYTPNTDYIGVDEFTFTVDDNDGDTSDDGVISVNVIELQDPVYKLAIAVADWVALTAADITKWQVPASLTTGTLAIRILAATHGKGTVPDRTVHPDISGFGLNWNSIADDNGDLIFIISSADATDGYIKVRE